VVLAREKERLEAAAEEAAEATKTVVEVAAAVEHCASPGVPLDEVRVRGGTPASFCGGCGTAEAIRGCKTRRTSGLQAKETPP
jgi:FAD/FMN-containing dehydrogenase